VLTPVSAVIGRPEKKGELSKLYDGLQAKNGGEFPSPSKEKRAYVSEGGQLCGGIPKGIDSIDRVGSPRRKSPGMLVRKMILPEPARGPEDGF